MATLSRLTSAVNLGGSNPIIMEYEASQALLPGDFCYLNTSGQLVTVTSNGTNFDSNTSSAWIGRALGFAAANENALVIVACEDTLFEVPVWHSTAASARLARAQLGSAYAGRSVWLDGTDGNTRVHVVNLEVTSSPVFRPLAFIRHVGHMVPGHNLPWGDTANGEQYGRVGVSIVPTARRLA